MKAFSSLEHSHFHFGLILISNLFVTEFTKTFFFLLLDLLVIGRSSLSLPHVHEPLDRVSVEQLQLLLLDLLVIVQRVGRGGRWDLAHVIVRVFVLFNLLRYLLLICLEIMFWVLLLRSSASYH